MVLGFRGIWEVGGGGGGGGFLGVVPLSKEVEVEVFLIREGSRSWRKK